MRFHRSNSLLLRTIVIGLLVAFLALFSEGLFVLRSRPRVIEEWQLEMRLKEMVDVSQGGNTDLALTILDSVVKRRQEADFGNQYKTYPAERTALWNETLSDYLAGADANHLSRFQLEQNPTFGMWLYTLGLLAYYQDEVDFAIYFLAAAARVEPREEFFIELGNYLSWHGKWDEARQLLEQCRQLSLGTACATFLSENLTQKQLYDVAFLKEQIFRNENK